MAGENGGSHGSVGCIDIISGLPDEIRERILGYLPICDAVRSSVLSRKWRYSWTRAPQLNLCLDEELETDMDFSSEEYRGWVGRILLSHVGPIHTFILHMTLRDRDEDLNTWLLFLSRNGIKDLKLLNEEFLDFFYVPQSIFQCLGLSCLTLRKINLYSSLPFRGFPNLTKLVLFDVDIPGDMLEQVISCCLLEPSSSDVILKKLPELLTDLVEETFSKDSLTAATAYVDAVDKEEIKTSVTTLSVTISRYYVNEEYIGAQTALMGSIVLRNCPAKLRLCIKSPQAVWSFFKQTKDHLFRR
ncbi:hypothetical protein QQ045_019888 [Rhodiola kirilowii]